MAEIGIFDVNGNERDPAWLRANFGDVVYRSPTAGPGWRLVELRERIGDAVLIATLRGVEGHPGRGVKVARCWSGDICGENLYSPDLSHLDPLPEELATWFDRGVWGLTEGPEELIGAIGYGIGRGDAYNLRDHSRGASAIWPEGNADQVLGLGWMIHYPDGSLTQYRALESVFEWSDDDPGPGPGDDPYILAAEALETIGDGWLRLGGLLRSLAE